MKKKRHLLSVCIPTYGMRGHGPGFLKQSLTILSKQTFKDFDVIISDYSEDDLIKQVVGSFNSKLDIQYFRNKNTDVPVTRRMSANTNNALLHATGKLAKILFLDDFLYDSSSLEHIVAAFDLKVDHWLVTACEHTTDGKTFTRPFYPKYSQDIYLGNNTISSPSVLTVKNEKPLLFDENLTWLMDCDYYKRCYDAFGEPKVLSTIAVVNRIGNHQISNVEATKALKKAEYDYIITKYGLSNGVGAQVLRALTSRLRKLTS